jgi:putative FmdB family regulatory protein
MPTYSFRCRRHGAFDVVLSMKNIEATHECPKCGRPCKREYSMPQVVRDTYKRPQRMSAYPSVREGAGPREFDTINTRTEKKAWIKKINQQRGWKLTQD